MFCFFNLARTTDDLLKHKRDKLKFGIKGRQKYNNINYKQIDKTMKKENKNIKIKKTTTNKENVISREEKTKCTRKKKKKYNT